MLYSSLIRYDQCKIAAYKTENGIGIIIKYIKQTTPSTY